MFAEIEGVVNDVPVPIAVPPVALANQESVSPVEDVALRITVPVPQRLFGVGVRTVGIALTVKI